ncbi:MAG TPA: L-threonylcarbamoyladenylate synthase [Acidimicrobiales bacterium]|nr:L-threonylcarbamoyladenylate synthase [Acidimicrobiales bacterium]
MATEERMIEVLRAGEPVLLPTDTVYGLAARAADPGHARRVYELKGRVEAQPSALLTADVDALLDCLPELRGGLEKVIRALLPGPYTLVLPNPAQRFRWLAGGRPDAIGVRVPELSVPAQHVVDAVTCVVATSANDPGGPNPATLDDVPEHIRAGCGAELDVGPLPGTPSTVLDLTRREPRVLREGAVPAPEALALARAALK